MAQTSEKSTGSHAGRFPPSVPTLICTNALFLQHTAVCLASLLANNPDLFFDIVIVRRHDQELDEGKLARSLTRFSNYALSFREFSLPPALRLPLNPKAHYTIDTYTRLWVGEFFPPSVSRVLYLDADIVIVGSIAPLWNSDLNGALLGVVDIPGSDRGVTLLRIESKDRYFNAGVLLVDLDQWRATNATETVLDYIRRYPERALYDQDALNACFYARCKRLAYKWNATWSFFHEPNSLPLSRAELKTVQREAVVIHFNGGSKPWSYFCAHPRKSEYNKYLRMTEWRDYVPPDRTPINVLRRALGDNLPAPIKRPIKAILKRIPAARYLVKPA